MYKLKEKDSFILSLIIIIIGGIFFWQKIDTKKVVFESVNSFEECVASGQAVLESYPRQCISKGGQHFVEEIGDLLAKNDLVRLDNIQANQIINSPLYVSGQARGFWFFEASFPIVLTDTDKNIISTTIATAQGEWMTEDFVSFEANLDFERPGDNKGYLIFKKDNPSGLLEHHDEFVIPIFFQ